MDIQEFSDRIAEQFEDLGGAVVTAETKFRDLPSWSSIVALSIIMMISDMYGVEMSAGDLKTAQTVQDVYDFVNSHR